MAHMGKKDLLTIHKVRSQVTFLEMIFDSAIGERLLSQLTVKAGLNKISAIEYQPLEQFGYKPSVKSLRLPHLHFGVRSDREGWLVAVLPFPREKKSLSRAVTRFSEVLDEIATIEGLKAALVVITDQDLSGVADLSSEQASVVVSFTWAEFLDMFSVLVRQSIPAIPPFKFGLLDEWMSYWFLTQTLKSFQNVKFPGYVLSITIPTNLNKTRFELVVSGRETHYALVRGSISSISLKSGILSVELYLPGKKNTHWRNRWELLLPQIGVDLHDLFCEVGYTPLTKPIHLIPKLSRKSLKKLERSRVRLKFEFDIEAGQKMWLLGKRPLTEGLEHLVQTYLAKVAPLIQWVPEDISEVEEDS